MLTKKDLLKIIATIMAAVAVVFALLWLICKITPVLIVAIIFLPWLGAALGAGADI